MSKSIKFKNNILIDSSGIIHNGENLGTLITKTLYGTLGCYDLGNKGTEFNLDDLKVGQSCFWDFGTPPINAPFKGGRCYCFKQYAYFQMQIAVYHLSPKICVRVYWNGVFTSWKELTLT